MSQSRGRAPLVPIVVSSLKGDMVVQALVNVSQEAHIPASSTSVNNMVNHDQNTQQTENT